MRLRHIVLGGVASLLVVGLAVDAAGSRTLLENALYCATGGVCRPAKQKLGDLVSVKDLGAVANDASKAALNTLAFQAALDVGGTIRVPGVPGDTFYMNASGVYTASTLAIGDDTRLEVDSGVIIKQAASQNVSLLTTKAYQTTQTSVTITWSAGSTASVAWTSHGFVAGDYCAIKGAAQSAFVGVFNVVSITDANNFVVQLQETPTGVATGTITAVKANRNITITGGWWDYNFAGNAAGVDNLRSLMVLGYAQRIEVSRVRLKDASLYGLVVGSVRDYLLTQIQLDSTHATTMKIYGPAFNGEASLITGRVEDDGISVQAIESAAFLSKDFTGGGSVLGCTIRHVGVDEGGSGTSPAVNIYLPLSTSPWRMDGIVVDDVTGNVHGNASRVQISGDPADASYSPADNISISNVHPIDTGTGYGILVNSKSYVKNLRLSGITIDDPGIIAPNPGIFITGKVDTLSLRDSTFLSPSGVAMSAAGAVIDVVNIDNVRASGVLSILGVNAGTYTVVNIRGCSVAGSAANGSLMSSQGAVTISSVNMIGNHMGSGTHSLFRYQSGTISGTTRFLLDGNYVEAPIGVQNNYTMNVSLRDNTFVNASSGVLRLNDAGTQTFKLYASGNTITAGSAFVFLNGAEKLSVFSADLSVPLASLQRTAGSMAIASVLAGTIVAGTLAACDATAAANSWKQVTNTANQF